jgi:hypothetical protein
MFGETTPLDEPREAGDATGAVDEEVASVSSEVAAALEAELAPVDADEAAAAAATTTATFPLELLHEERVW